MIIPSYRNQGIASEALKQILIKANEMDIKEVLMVCEDDNAISKHMLEKAIKLFGGYQDSTEERRGVKMLRYWVKTSV